jgi:hypothetical protein
MATLALVCSLVGATFPGPAHADTSEKQMESLTKSTIYGALLGGLLGLTSALVVRDSARDDVIRWGVALGAFSGFAYGVYGIGHGSDSFSRGFDGNLPSGSGPTGQMRGGGDPDRADRRDLIGGWRLGERSIVRFPEVGHDGFKEEDSQIQELGAGRFARLGEAADDLTRPDRGTRGQDTREVVR